MLLARHLQLQPDRAPVSIQAASVCADTWRPITRTPSCRHAVRARQAVDQIRVPSSNQVSLFLVMSAHTGSLDNYHTIYRTWQYRFSNHDGCAIQEGLPL